ncbi:hypothetical protein ACJX0J_029178 [Zea mays]
MHELMNIFEILKSSNVHQFVFLILDIKLKELILRGDIFYEARIQSNLKHISPLYLLKNTPTRIQIFKSGRQHIKTTEIILVAAKHIDINLEPNHISKEQMLHLTSCLSGIPNKKNTKLDETMYANHYFQEQTQIPYFILNQRHIQSEA